MLAPPRPAVACLQDVALDAGSPGSFTLFPNWVRAKTSIFDLIFCDATTCSWGYVGDITGLTIMNFGTATGGPTGDITQLYFCVSCAAACPAPTQTMTYAGVWGARTAWTWAGNLVINVDPCDLASGCGSPCSAALHLWVDINSCPADKATVSLGPAYNAVFDEAGISDQYGCGAPWASVSDVAIKTIAYTMKQAGRDVAAPGDTITYTIAYGLPGSAAITQITVFDSIPYFTSYLPGSASTTPDPFWDPDIGPPQTLRWTLPGAASTAGGPTRIMTYSVSVDWGNEPFDSGSGGGGAPEGQRLSNRAQIFWANSDCPPATAVTPAAETVVRRFLAWLEADNDVLFASVPGMPADEVIYTLFLRNTSTARTWWNVHIWDTVPPQLEVLTPDCGFDDPCTGWTMTPSGCAAASPGRTAVSNKTILTWALNLPPGSTIALRWKARVNPTAPAGATATNLTSVLEYGYNGANGTGHSMFPAVYTSLTSVILRTTYVSYTAIGSSSNDNIPGCPGFFLAFFPLNRNANFELYGLEYMYPSVFASYGGVSASIGTPAGSCLSGFNGPLSPGGLPGCGGSRVPTRYIPAAWQGVCADHPENFIYKIVSNSPVVWQTLTVVNHDNLDNHTYAPTTSLTYRGFTAYCYRRAAAGTCADTSTGDSLDIINTGIDPWGNFNPTIPTTVFIFRWDTVTYSWSFLQSLDLDGESQGSVIGNKAAGEGYYRILSSNNSIIVRHSMNPYNTLCCCCKGCGIDHSAMAPFRETGNTVSPVDKGNAYLYVTDDQANGTDSTDVVIGNTGTVNATYRIWQYIPSAVAVAPTPAMLAGTSGKWSLVGSGTVGAGINNAANPHAYGGVYDPLAFRAATTALFKVELTDGGPIQILHGADVPALWAGGTIVHAADGNQTGKEFWYNQTAEQPYNCNATGAIVTGITVWTDVFCPKTGMVVNATTNDGFSATYTTDGPDQCVAFMKLTIVKSGDPRRNWVFSILPSGKQGNAIMIYNMCKYTEKGYTSPFVQTGTHYMIITPPIVYSGQSFWLTVLVLATGGETLDDYCGTTSFTSTDPTATLESVGLNSYVYAWKSGSGTCSGVPNDDGVHIFFNVTFNLLGMQSIVATDVTDGSITGLASVLVVGVDIKLSKEPRFATAASGDTVQFRICWSNYSSASAFTFVITDAVPVGMTYLPDAAANHFCGSTLSPTFNVAYSTSTTTTAPGSFTTVPSGNLPTGVRWLRWTVQTAGVNTTGCACFKVTVD